MNQIQLSPLSNSAANIEALQAIFGGESAQGAFTALPPGKGYEDKFTFGIFKNKKLIGFADIIRGFPQPNTAMLGLLFISKNDRLQGLGRWAYQEIESRIRNWNNIDTIRLGVIESNELVTPFWKKMGFESTGERRADLLDPAKPEAIIFEKKITPLRQRHVLSMKLTALHRLGTNEIGHSDFLVREINEADCPSLGSLLFRAYVGTIDDEGESESQQRAEAHATFRHKYGLFVPSASFLAFDRDQVVSATLVTLWKDRPLLAQSITDPAFQGRGLATHLIQKTMNSLLRQGYKEIRLAVTIGNQKAERLYEKLGFT